jgi:hypothetical protein
MAGTSFTRYGVLMIGGNVFNQAGYFTEIDIAENIGYSLEFGMVPNNDGAGYSKGPHSVTIRANYKVPVDASKLVLLSDLNWDTQTYDLMMALADFSGNYTGLKQIVLNIKPVENTLSLDYSRAGVKRVSFLGVRLQEVKG